MIQLYFLSILCNGLAGYVLFLGNGGSSGDGTVGGSAGIDSDLKPRFPVNNPTFFLILGILCIVTGVLKLLSPTLDGIPILGDLIPSAAGIVAGLVLIFGIYRQDVSGKSGELDRIGTSLLAFRKPIGLGLLVISLIHFLFPKALFL